MKQSSGIYCINMFRRLFYFEQKRRMEIGMAVLLLCSVYWLSGQGARLASETLGKKETVVVLDPGHGRRRVRRGGRL